MRLAVDAADHAGTSLNAAETVRRWLDQAADHGAADLDFSGVVATILGRPARAMSGARLERAGAAQAQASGKRDHMPIKRIGLVVNDAKSEALDAADIVRAWASEHGVRVPL